MKSGIFVLLLIAIFLAVLNGQCSVHADENPRIISLTPSTTEILFSLGLGDNIVGVTSFCNYPKQALSIEKTGSFSQPNIEKIISLNPDLILLTGLEQQPTAEKLKKLGLNFLVVYPSDIKGLYSSIRKIGRAAGSQQEAEELINKINKRLDKLKARTSLIPGYKRKTVFIEIWHDPIITAGAGSFVGELVELAGGINIAKDTLRAYSRFSAETVISRDPDCIILGYMAGDQELKRIKQRTGWENIKAIRNNNIIGDIDPDLILRPGPRFVEGVEKIYERLYGH
ncbi:MAG: cobalamin-binding protein [Candidatus Omnitrophota bacterium]|nr:cobalamin-binding protein [Candidatus Omnitrophota bacterium]